MRIRMPLVVTGALAMIMGVLATGTAASAAPAVTQDNVGVAAVKQYAITVHTANIPNAGTDATVQMKVYGTLNTSPGYVNLDNDEENFERNKTDRFSPFFWFDIGRPDYIGVYKGSNGSEWYPEYAVVHDLTTGAAYFCPMNAYYGDGADTQWFDCP